MDSRKEKERENPKAKMLANPFALTCWGMLWQRRNGKVPNEKQSMLETTGKLAKGPNGSFAKV